MGGLLAGIAAVTIPVVLIGSVCGHLRRPGVLAAALAAHGTVPRRLVRPVAAFTTAVEGVLGATAVIGLLLGLDGLLRASLAAAAALLAGHGLYATYVTRARPHRVPCGCAGNAESLMTGWVAARAGMLAGLALAGAAWDPPPSLVPAEQMITVAMGLGFAVLLWTLPLALLSPACEPSASTGDLRPSVRPSPLIEERSPVG
jgi:hypothetical protein